MDRAWRWFIRGLLYVDHCSVEETWWVDAEVQEFLFWKVWVLLGPFDGLLEFDIEHFDQVVGISQDIFLRDLFHFWLLADQFSFDFGSFYFNFRNKFFGFNFLFLLLTLRFTLLASSISLTISKHSAILHGVISFLPFLFHSVKLLFQFLAVLSLKESSEKIHSLMDYII